MPRIVHVVEQLTLGGGARAHIAVAKYSARSADFQHAIASLLPPRPEAVELARSGGLEVLAPESRAELHALLERADIVHLGWWNSPEMAEFLRSPLPSARLCVWLHVAGDRPPQVITRELVDMADLAMAVCPHSLRVAAFRQLPDDERRERSTLVYPGADFERLGALEASSHAGFNVGYVGTLNFQKLHPDYVRMSAAIRVPDLRLVVCGTGGEQILREQAAVLGVADRFDFRGYVADVAAVFAELDVFGYPLCENTYAAGELVLQEVMYAGIPPVVFPYGGIRDLVIPDFTGLVVTSPREYSEAVEHLYRDPQDRARLGRNAREYASQIFGAENAARSLNQAYRRLLERPKRSRTWGTGAGAESLPVAALMREDAPGLGATRLIEGLGSFAGPFRASLTAAERTSLPSAEEEIAQADDLLWDGTGGIRSYRDYYPSDPWLRFWSGLVLRERGLFEAAIAELRAAIELGFSHWRGLWYLAQTALEAGHWLLAQRTLKELRATAPGRPDPPGMFERLSAALDQRRSLLRRFREQMEHGDSAGAEASLGKAVRQFPHSPDVQNALAEYQIQTGDRGEAVGLLERLAVATPDHTEILNNLAVVRWQEGDRDAALTLLRAASLADPDDTRVRANLAELSGASAA